MKVEIKKQKAESWNTKSRKWKVEIEKHKRESWNRKTETQKLEYKSRNAKVERKNRLIEIKNLLENKNFACG